MNGEVDTTRWLDLGFSIPEPPCDVPVVPKWDVEDEDE